MGECNMMTTDFWIGMGVLGLLGLMALAPVVILWMEFVPTRAILLMRLARWIRSWFRAPIHLPPINDGWPPLVEGDWYTDILGKEWELRGTWRRKDGTPYDGLTRPPR